MAFFLFILYFILVGIKLIINNTGGISIEVWYYLLDPLLTLTLIIYFIKISMMLAQRKLIILALVCSCFEDLLQTTFATLGANTCDKNGKCVYVVGTHISNIDTILAIGVLVLGLLMYICYITAIVRTQSLSRSSYIYLVFGIILYMISMVFSFAYGVAGGKMDLEPLPYLLAQFFIVKAMSKLKINK
jgi:hypothetical protein